MQKACRFLLLFFICWGAAWANNPSPWYSLSTDNKAVLNIELYLSSTCPYCHKADAFFKEIEKTAPWLHVQRHIINQDKASLQSFSQLLNEQKMDDFAIPSIFFCNSRWVGFASPETTGKDLLYAINYCKQQIEQKGQLSDTTVSVLRRWANANQFDSGMTENPTAPHYLTVVALMDAYNPCALFCLGGFFALLFMQHQRKQQVITGLSFILGVGIVHFIQQHFTSTFFELLPWLRLPAAALGLIVLAAIFYVYKHKSLNNNIFYGIAFLLGLMLQAYQQTCIMNWAYIFEQWLYNQHYSSGERSLIQLIYQIMYLVPLALALVLYTILIRAKRLTNHLYRLQAVAMLYLSVMGVVLIIYPQLLSHLGLSFIVILVVFVSGWSLARVINPQGSEE